MNSKRLADRILAALQLAIEQKDKGQAEILLNALQIALTKDSGGKDFVERRDLSDAIIEAMDAVDVLRKEVEY